VKVAFQTFGCRSNYADTIDLQAALSERGVIACSECEGSDVIVVNTCSVTDNADKEALRFIRKAKKAAPDARIVVTGCLAELSPDDLSDLEDVDSVVGPGRKQDVLASILEIEVSKPSKADQDIVPIGRKSLPLRKSISLDDEISPEISGPGQAIGEVSNRARYHLRIQEGCENSCTFCIIPFTRGRLSSRPMYLLRDDIEKLAKVGYREVVLTGTHIGGYGEDFGGSLLELLELLSTDCPVARIRLSSIDPNDLSLELLDFIANSKVLCPHLHICVQAFSDKVLKRMSRRYSLQDVERILCYIKAKVPGVCIGTDVIAGFPGESRQELDQGVEEFLRLPFSYLHVFPYSERSGTAATRLDGSVSLAERRRRAARWRSVGERRRLEFYDSLVGSNLQMVVETLDKEFAYGTSGEYAALKLPLCEINKQELLELGSIVNVQGACVEKEQRKLRCQLLSQES
jgi:threonylcarbamoyladenosine tRNA methylthiotransferase MtaB